MTHLLRTLISIFRLNESALVGEITTRPWSADDNDTHFQSMDWQMRLRAEGALLLLDTACSGHRAYWRRAGH